MATSATTPRRTRDRGPRSLRCLLPLALALLPGVARAQAPAARDTASAAVDDGTREVRRAMGRFLDALNALDLAGLDSAFADEVTAFVPTARPGVVEGRAAVMAVFREFVARTRATTPRLALEPEDMRITPGGDLHVVSFVTRGAAPSVTRRRTFVFRRVGARWLIVHMHASDVPGAGR